MKKIDFLAIITMLFTVILSTQYSFSREKQQPSQSPVVVKKDPVALPDFSKPPFINYGKDWARSIFHEEFGKLMGELHADGTNLGNTKNFVMVFYAEEDKIIYAEWIEVKEGFTRCIVRGYCYKEGKFVFEKEEEKDYLK